MELLLILTRRDNLSQYDYVSSYIHIFYQNDESVLNDPEVCDYWKHFENLQPGVNYKLPKLSLNILIEHLT